MGENQQNKVSVQSVRTKGIYQSEPLRHSLWQYIRFYADGTVLAVSSFGNPQQVIEWLNKQWSKKRGYSGEYIINGSEISFSIKTRQGIVVYKGQIRENTLLMNIHSHINGNKCIEEYKFIQIDVSSED